MAADSPHIVAIEAGPSAPKQLLTDDARPDVRKGEDVKQQQQQQEDERDEAVSWFKLLSGADKLDKLMMAVGTIGGIGNGLAWPIFAILFKQFANAFGSPDTTDFMASIIDIALKFLYLGIGSMAGMYLQSAFWMWSGHRQTRRLRTLYLAAALRQDMSFFDTTATTGGLLQGLNEHSNDVQAAISEKVGNFIQHMVTFVAGIIVAFTAGWDMTLVMLGTLPFLAAVGAILAKITTVMSAKSTAAYQGASSLLQQSLAQVRTVAAYGAEERTIQAYTEALERPTRLGVLSGIYSGLALGAVNTVVYWTYAVAFVYGAWRVYQGKYDGGQVLQVMLAILLGGFSLGQAAPIFETFSKGRAQAVHIFRVIDRVPAIDPDSDQGKKLAPEELEGCIELRDVVFAYPVRPEVRVFHGFSLVMPGGRTTALVGSSGSGKSTVVALVQRFYDPEGGQVLVDGVDLRQLNVKWLRGQVGLVSQEPTLFATTIGENISMGRPGATQAEIEQAAALANAHQFITLLPAGYDTHVGERGLQLSGGQKQRIAIARAILKNPRILLLDEATSALDTRSEQVVQAALDNMIAGRTTIVVAHRLSTIRNADRIAVVQAGRVVELGTHKELINQPSGAYTTLVKLQMQEEAQRHQAEEVKAVEGEEDEEEEDVGVPEEEGDLEGDGTSEGTLSRPVPKLHALPPAAAAAGDASSSSLLLHAPGGGPPAIRTPTDATTITTTITSASSQGLLAHAGSTISATAAAAVSKPADPEAAIVAGAAATSPAEGTTPVAATATATLEMVVVAGEEKGAGDGGGTAGKEGGVGGGGAHRRHHRKAGKGRRGSKGKTGCTKDGKEGEEEKAKAAEEVDVPFSRLVQLNRPEWPYAVPAVVGSTMLGLLQPAFAFLLASFIVLFYDSDKAYVKSRGSFWAWMFFLIGWCNLLASVLQMAGFGKMGSELARRVRIMVLRNILYQNIGWFDEESNSSGTLSSKLSSDAAHIRGAVADTVGIFVQNAVTLAAGYGIAFGYDWRMALVVTGALPFIISGSVLFYVAATSASAGSSKLFGAANQAVSDAFTSIRVVQSYRLQSHMTDLYGRLTRQADVKGERQAHVMGLLMGYGQLSIFGVYSLVIWFGGLEVESGRSDFDSFLKAFFGILFACFGIAQAQVGFPDVGKAKEAVRSIFPILDRKTLIDASDPSGLTKERLEGAIELRDVRFAYPSRASVVVFKDFSLEIAAGKQVALVGESGSGKSTVVGLILRFYDVLGGQVLVDGVDVRQYNLRWLRSHIGLVSQEPLLFSATVLSNITFGKPDASMDEVEAAARVANAWDFIMSLPDGFNTQIGEKGVQLSGGQKQRVAIARAVLKNPRILLLDEATSALDAASERVVQDALDHIMLGRTSVVVAHRLSTIRNADKIALVQRGHILEQGNHAELMALPDGGYARLVAAQNREGGAGPAAGN